MPHSLKNKRIEEEYEFIIPFVEKMKAKYPKEVNIDGLEPALTNDIAEICLEARKDERKKMLIEMKKIAGINSKSYNGKIKQGNRFVLKFLEDYSI